MSRPMPVLIVGGPLDGARYTDRFIGQAIAVYPEPEVRYSTSDGLRTVICEPEYYVVERLVVFGRVLMVAVKPGLSEAERCDLLWKHLVRSDMHDLAVDKHPALRRL